MRCIWTQYEGVALPGAARVVPTRPPRLLRPAGRGSTAFWFASIQQIGGQGVKMADEKEFSVVAVSFFGKWSAGRFPTREQAEWQVKKLNEQAERNPRGYIQYLVRPVEGPSEEG